MSDTTYNRYSDGREETVLDRNNQEVITTRQNLITALELGGYILREKAGYMEFDDDTSKIIDVSAIGIMALNHGVGLPSLREFLQEDGTFYDLWGTSKSLKRIVTMLKKRWKDDLTNPISLRFYDYSFHPNYQDIKIR